MGWEDDSGRHEGWSAAITKDGRKAGTHNGQGVVVEGITGNYRASKLIDGYEEVPADDVTGWRISCSCGWEGQNFIPRKPGESTFVDDDAEDNILYPEWRKHIEPIESIARLQKAFQAHWRATDNLNEAAREAKKAGATWQEIAIATRMSRQAAHERWGKAESGDGPVWG